MSKVPHTRIFDELVPEFGLLGAAVYGVIWRYCQMRDGACRASYTTLSGDIGVGKSTIYRNVQRLRDAGYLAVIHDRDNSPNWLILGEKHVGRETTRNKARSQRDDAHVVTETTRKGEHVVRETTEETRELKKPIKKLGNATHSRKRKRAPFWNDDQKVLAEHFAEVSGLPIPKLEGRAFAAVTKSWKLPLSEMFELSGSVTEAKHLIERTIGEMRADNLTISAPRSIWNNALSIHARGPTNGPSGEFWGGETDFCPGGCGYSKSHCQCGQGLGAP